MNNFKKLLESILNESQVKFASGIVTSLIIADVSLSKAKSILDKLNYEYSIKKYEKHEAYYVPPIPVNKNRIPILLTIKLKDEDDFNERMVIRRVLKKAKIKILEDMPDSWTR